MVTVCNMVCDKHNDSNAGLDFMIKLIFETTLAALKITTCQKWHHNNNHDTFTKVKSLNLRLNPSYSLQEATISPKQLMSFMNEPSAVQVTSRISTSVWG